MSVSSELVSSGTHPFETAGLGKSPFQFVGMIKRECSGVPDSHGFSVGYAGQPAGSCDFCGQGIKYCCQIKSADGKQFEVGTDCVCKLGRDDNALVERVEREVKAIEKQQRDERKAKRVARENLKIEAAAAVLATNEAVREQLAAKRHPHFPAPDKTLLDYCEWLIANGGQSGRLRAVHYINAASNTVVSDN